MRELGAPGTWREMGKDEPEEWELQGDPGRRKRGAGEGWGVPAGMGGWVTHSGVPFDMPGEHSSTQGTLHGQGGIGRAVAAGSEVRPRMEGWAGGEGGGRAGRDGAGRDIPGTPPGDKDREAGNQIPTSPGCWRDW